MRELLKWILQPEAIDTDPTGTHGTIDLGDGDSVDWQLYREERRWAWGRKRVRWELQTTVTLNGLGPRLRLNFDRVPLHEGVDEYMRIAYDHGRGAVLRRRAAESKSPTCGT